MNRDRQISGLFGPRRGVAMLEMIGYVAIAAVIVNLGLSIFISSSRLARLGMDRIEHRDASAQLRQTFVDRVRQSRGVVGAIGEYESGANRVILDLGASPYEPGVNRYAIWGEWGDDNAIGELIVHQAGDVLEPGGFVLYDINHTATSFQYDAEPPSNASYIELRIEQETNPKKLVLARAALRQ